MQKNRFSSLAELRAEKDKELKRLDTYARMISADTKDAFIPTNNQFVNSAMPYANYIGYGITAYKTFRTVKRIVSYIKSHRWR